MRKNKCKWLCAVIIFFSMMIVSFANSAIPQIDPITGTVVFDDQTGIALTSEIINLNFKEGQNASEFNIVYNLKNTQKENRVVNFWFIAQKPYSDKLTDDKFFVYEGNKAYATSQVDCPAILNWNHNISNRYINPYTGKVIEEPFFSQTREGIVYNEFTVEFQGNEEKQLFIEFQSQNGYMSRSKGLIGDFVTQLYYITPAKFYDGEVNVELNVYVDNSDMKFASNMPFSQLSDRQYHCELNALPTEEITYTLVNPKGKIFGTNVVQKHNLYFSIIMVCVVLASIMLYRKSGNKIYIKDMLIILALLLALFGYQTDDSYGRIFIIYIFLFNPVSLLILFIISIFRIKKYWKTWKAD